MGEVIVANTQATPENVVPKSIAIIIEGCLAAVDEDLFLEAGLALLCLKAAGLRFVF